MYRARVGTTMGMAMYWWSMRIIALLGITFVALLGYAGFLYTIRNYHVVIPGELYRSGQLSPETLAERQRQDGFKSVLNLRGASPGKPWYDAEIAMARQLGLTHVDFSLSAKREVTPEQTEALLAIMREMPKPILIHCMRGADRTGFAVAMYMADIKKAGLARAGGQLSVFFGHFGIPHLSKAYPMDVSWQREVAARGFSN
jgi:protein tyrosine/serine phosphatase